MASHFTKELWTIVSDYRAAGGAWPPRKTELAEWALARNRWFPSREDIRRMCGEALADAMRDQTFTDESGRTVRALLPARTMRGGEQGTFWDDVRTAPIAHVRSGVKNRRDSIAAEAYHLFKIVRYSNEHRPATEQIQLILDFNEDVRELDQPVLTRRKAIAPSATEPQKQSEQPRPAVPPSVSPRAPSRRVRRPSAPA